MRPGVRVACDVGSVRIGMARSDGLGMLAVPLDAVPADDDALAAVCDVLREWEAVEVYVGLPLHLSGQEGQASELARRWAASLAERTDVPIRLIDERLSTVQAQRALHASGRSTRQSRSLIDSAAAVMVLQSALDHERPTGALAGEPVQAGMREEEG